MELRKEEARKDTMVTMGGGTQISGDTSQESRERTLYNIRYSILLNDDQLDYLARTLSRKCSLHAPTNQGPLHSKATKGRAHTPIPPLA